MMNVNIGPFVMQLGHLLLLMSVGLASVVGFIAARRRKVTGVNAALVDVLVAGLLAGRVGFVIQWFAIYREDWLTIFDVRDGGFSAGWAVAGAAVAAAWRIRRRAELREPLTMAILAGVLSWFVAGGTGTPDTTRGASLPSLQLSTVTGAPASLRSFATGKPIVVNLWATWCPPCRREMPVLAAAQARAGDVVFLFVNQGEDAATAQRYLQAERIRIDNVLLDPASATGKAVGSAGLPTTLFYDASGKLSDVHLGALTAASLASKLDALRVHPLKGN